MNNTLEIKSAVITGATGAIGTALIEELTKNGAEVLVLCRKGSPRNKKIPTGPLVTIKYCELAELKSLENDTGKSYDVFYHLAWDGTFGTVRNDMYLQNKNIEYALDAVGAAARLGCKRFVGAGSQAEYGRSAKKLTPDTPTFPENGYGYAKLCAGQMTRSHAHSLGMEHVWVRILSVYGPNDNENSMVISTIAKLKNGEIPGFTKGEQIWDYLYSTDAARALYLVGICGKDSAIYPLGSGEARPLAEYIRNIRDIVAPDASLDIGAVPYSENQVMHLCADITALKADTGFYPAVSFDEGIKRISDLYETRSGQ